MKFKTAMNQKYLALLYTVVMYLSRRLNTSKVLPVQFVLKSIGAKQNINRSGNSNVKTYFMELVYTLRLASCMFSILFPA